MKIFYGKRTVRKSVTMKIFEYSSLGKRLKTQTDITKDQYKLLKDLKIMLLRTTEKIVKIEKIRVVKLILLKCLTQY